MTKELARALDVIAAHGKNRDPIYAPDGRTWYQTALAEAERRGKFQDALRIIAMQEKSDEREQEGDLEGGFDAIVDVAREAIAETNN